MTRRSRGVLASIGLLLLGALGGILLTGAARFFGQTPEHPVHYHANWAIFLDGERLDLTANRYMEDVMRCMADASHLAPEDRVHMHENNQDIVHVHAAGVTWGHLLANIGFGIGDDYLVTDSARHQADDQRDLKFILNGDEVGSIRNRLVGDEDRLLISFGPETVEEVTASQFTQVASTAGSFNLLPDPASCSGQQQMGLGDRLRRAFWF